MGIFGSKWKIIRKEKTNDDWKKVEEDRKKLFDEAVKFASKEA